MQRVVRTRAAAADAVAGAVSFEDDGADCLEVCLEGGCVGRILGVLLSEPWGRFVRQTLREVCECVFKWL